MFKEFIFSPDKLALSV